MSRPRLDFKAISDQIGVEQVAEHHLIEMKRSGREMRGCCHCDGADHRSLALYPEQNSFRCYHSSISGDSIALHSHLNGLGMYAAAQSLIDLFGEPASAGRPTTPPRAASAETTAPKDPAPFDPDKFFAKLQFEHEEVQALGYAPEDAERVGLGFHPTQKVLYVGHRNADGSWSGFSKIKGGKLSPPPRWIASNVVPLKRRA